MPELRAVPDEFLPEPELVPPLLQTMIGCRVGVDYPEPIVDHRTAYRHAQERLFGLRATAAAREEARSVQRRHGSRKGAAKRRA